MNKKVSKQFVGVLALLCSSAGMATTVTVTTPGTVVVGDTFLVTISGSGFIPDTDPGLPDETTIGASLDISFSSGLSYAGPLGPCPPCTGAPAGSGRPATGPFSSGNGGTYDPHFTAGVLTSFDMTTPVGADGSFDFLVLAFQATAPGAQTITLIDNGTTLSWFQYNAPFDVITVETYNQGSVTVNSPAAANITVTDSVTPNSDHDVPFGGVTELTSANQTITVTNTGSANLTVGTLALVDTLADPPFSLVNDMCSGQVLTPGTPCTVGVRFSPVATGDFNDSFDIPSNDPDPADNPITVLVSGTGTPTPVPNATVTDTALPADDHNVPFGNITEGGLATKTVVIQNTGTATLNVGALTPLAAPFSLVNDMCSGQPLTPQTPCSVDVQFSPVTTGDFRDSFDIPSNDPDPLDNPITVLVSGTGISSMLPDISVDDTQLDFGNVNITATADQTVTVTNDGAADLTIGNVGVATPLAAPFSIVADNCTLAILAPTDTCTISVRFTPDALGPVNSSFDIPSDDLDEATVNVGVSGIGAPVPVGNVTVTDSINPAGDLQVPFGNIGEHTTSTQTVTVTNDGNAALVLGQVATLNRLAEPFSIVAGADNCSGQTLAPAAPPAPAESCTISVEFAPGAIAIYNDAFDIPSDDPDEPTVTVAVNGGAQPGLRTDSPGNSAFDPLTLLGLSLFGFAAKRRRRLRV